MEVKYELLINRYSSCHVLTKSRLLFFLFSSEIQDTENTPGGTKPISKSEANAKASKVADEVTDISSNPGANNKSAAVNDDLKDLFCKNSTVFQ